MFLCHITLTIRKLLFMVTAKQLLDISEALDQLRDFLSLGMNHQAKKQKELLTEQLHALGYTLKEDTKKYYVIEKASTLIEQ